MNFFAFLAIFAINNGLILAQAATGASASPPTDLGGWLALLNIGLAGVGLIAFVKGWIVPGMIHQQALAREKAKEAELVALRKTIEEDVIPELARGKEVQEKMIALTQEFLKVIENQSHKN